MRKFNLRKQSFELNKNSCFTSCDANTSSMIRIFEIVTIENKLLKILTFKVETGIPCFFHIIKVDDQYQLRYYADKIFNINFLRKEI